MARKTVLVAGGSGLVGYACLKHLAARGDCDVLVLSRRPPPEAFGARVLRADLTDPAAGAALADAGLEPKDIDLIVCATSTPDNTFPATATTIPARIPTIGWITATTLCTVSPR